MRWLAWAFSRDSGAPPTAETAVGKALLAVLDGDLERAEGLLARAVRLDSDALDAYLALGRVYRKRGEIGRAIHIHQNLLLRPELDARFHLEALAELAADFRRGGFLRRAIASYEEVLARDGRHREALRALAQLCADVRDLERALEVERRLARVEKRESGNAEAALLVTLAERAHAESRSAEARRALKRALRKDRGNVRAWMVLGDLEAERGRTHGALDCWCRVPKLARRSGPEVYPRLETAFAAAGRTPDYEAFLRELLAEEAEDPGARLALARTLAARGYVDEAVAEVRRLLEREPENVAAHGTLGRILLAEHRDPEAVKEYAEFLEVLERQGFLRSRESTE